MKKIIIFLLLLSTPALAQSPCSYIQYGGVLTAGQWQQCFQGKNDNLGYTPVNKAGDTMTGKLITPPPGSVAGFNLTPGNAPSAPTDGDIWVTNSGLFVRAGGQTSGPSSAAHTLKGNNTGSQAPTIDLTVSQVKIMLGLTPAVFSSNTLASPTATTSTTAVMMGLGGTWTVTPNASGNVDVSITGYATNGTAAGLSSISLYFGTGTAPSNGAAFTGTVVNSAPVLVTSPTTGSPDVPFPLTARITGLTPGTPYWFDLALTASAGTSTIHVNTIIIKEE